MAEIIYDTAPGVRQMYFATGTLGAATKASNINALVAQGVKVIADDIFYIDEPFFQDGVVSQAVDAAKAAGVTYLASAGNRGEAELGGGLHTDAAPRGEHVGERLRPAGGSRRDPDARHVHEHAAVPLDAVGRTLGRRHDRPGSGRLADRGRCPDLHRDLEHQQHHVGDPAEFSASTSRASPRPSGSRCVGSAGTGTPFIKYIMGGTPACTPSASTRPTRTPSTPMRPRPRAR